MAAVLRVLLVLGTILVTTVVAGYLAGCVLVTLSRDAMRKATPARESAFRRGLYAAQRRGGRRVLALVLAWGAVLLAWHVAGWP